MTASNNNPIETELDNEIVGFVQNIINGYEQYKSDYLYYPDKDDIDLQELINCLNNLKILKKLCKISESFIASNTIVPQSNVNANINKDKILSDISAYRDKIKNILLENQKVYINAYDISDEEESEQVYSVVRSKKRKYRSVDKMLSDCSDAISSYKPISYSGDSCSAKVENTSPAESKTTVSDTSVSKEIIQTDKKSEKILNNTSAIQEVSHTLNFVDFDNIDYKYTKPVYLSYKGNRFNVSSWRDAYCHFITLLYKKIKYQGILISYIGKSLFSNNSNINVDFNRNNITLRKPYKIAPYFYIEVNLSSNDIIKRIAKLLDICNIDRNDLKIAYTAVDVPVEHMPQKDKLNARDDVKLENIHTDEPKIENESSKVEDKPLTLNGVSDAETEQDNDEKSDIFIPDLTKPFDLKDALFQIMSSNDERIRKYRLYKNGFKVYDLHNLIKFFYNKFPSTFDIATILYTKPIFKSVGRNYFAINESEIKAIDKKVEINTSKSSSEKNAVVEINKNESNFDSVSTPKLAVQNNINSEKDMLNNNSVQTKKNEYFEPTINIDVYNDKNDENMNGEKIEIYTDKQTQANTNDISSKRIALLLNNREYFTFDYSEALQKICEFAIRIKPFKMAKITDKNITINGKPVFIRDSVPSEGYARLSNNLQVILEYNSDNVFKIANTIAEICGIDKNMILFR